MDMYINIAGVVIFIAMLREIITEAIQKEKVQLFLSKKERRNQLLDMIKRQYLNKTYQNRDVTIKIIDIQWVKIKEIKEWELFFIMELSEYGGGPYSEWQRNFERDIFKKFRVHSRFKRNLLTPW
jgi:hypothetical protein